MVNGESSSRQCPALGRCLVVLVTAMLSGGLLACSSSQRACELGPYEDPAPHAAGWAAGDGVSLHYLDFGGTGEVLLFLAGAGDSAHVFDEFAPRFADEYHVLSMTRRGFGESSQPTTGYDSSQLAEDVATLLDSLGIDRAHVAGHSIAGAEMTELAVRHPSRVGKLIYLDAAYDWAASAEDPIQEAPPIPPGPRETELESPEGFAAFTASLNGLGSFPLADVRATNVFDCSGHYLRSKTPSSVARELADSAAAAHPKYASVQAPVLAVFTVPSNEEDMFPWLDDSPSQQPVAAAYFPPAQASLAAQRAAFAASQPNAAIENLDSSPHFLFLADPEHTASLMLTFLNLRPEAR